MPNLNFSQSMNKKNSYKETYVFLKKKLKPHTSINFGSVWKYNSNESLIKI